MTAILHSRLPVEIWMDPRTARLPGMLPLAPQDWLILDEAYAAQMAERRHLIAAQPGLVHALLPRARAAAGELMETIRPRLPGLGFVARDAGWTCPDGVQVPDDPDAPLLTLGRLLQSDFCLLQDGPSGHVLTGAILCFPSSWTLAQKIGRDMAAIHVPVASYDAGLAARVQRLFDAIRPEQPMWRGNVLDYDDPALFQPRLEGQARPPRAGDLGRFIRAERQSLLRLPRTRAVVFGIHVWQVAAQGLSPGSRAGLLRHLAAHG
jgi:hypothetical protein